MFKKVALLSLTALAITASAFAQGSSTVVCNISFVIPQEMNTQIASSKESGIQTITLVKNGNILSTSTVR